VHTAQGYSSAARLKLGRPLKPGRLNCGTEVEKWLEEAENTEAPDFEDIVAEYRTFQAQRVNTGLGRKNWRSWRMNMLEVLKATDSEIEVGMNFEAEGLQIYILMEARIGAQ
jgi:hypothetical protein